LDDDDADDADWRAGQLVSSPVGGRGALGRLLRRMLSVTREPGAGGPAGADAPARVGRPRTRGRGKVTPTSVAAGAVAQTTPFEPRGRKYPEWDVRRRRYRPDWRTVLEGTPRPQDLAPMVVPDALTFRRPLARLGTGLDRTRRRPQGDDIDIDAAVEARVELLAGSPPDEAVYVESLRRRRDLAVLILLDISGSAGEPGPAGRPVHRGPSSRPRLHPRDGRGAGMATAPPPPGPAHGHRHDGARLAGPDHELGALRGVQPPALALARDVAAGLALADRRAVHRDRLRHLLHGALLPGHLDPAAHPGASAAGVLRIAAPLCRLGGPDPRHRLRVRCVPRDLPGSHAAVRLLAGGPVRLDRLRRVAPVPADLGVVACHVGDDRCGSPALPRRHRPHPGREAGPPHPCLSAVSGPRDLPGHVRHRQRCLLRLWRRVRRHQGQQGRDVGRVPLAVP
jgi:hypothetical protein